MASGSSRSVVGVGGGGDQELAGGRVRERQSDGAVAGAVTRFVDHRGGVPRVGVVGFEQRSGRDDPRDLAVVIPRLVLELVGDRDAVATLDQCLQIRCEVVDRNARHRVRRAVCGLLGDLQIELRGDEFGVLGEELVEVAALHRQDVGVGVGLQREELLDDPLGGHTRTWTWGG